jgi:hypothetical protein
MIFPAKQDMAELQIVARRHSNMAGIVPAALLRHTQVMIPTLSTVRATISNGFGTCFSTGKAMRQVNIGIEDLHGKISYGLLKMPGKK